MENTRRMKKMAREEKEFTKYEARRNREADAEVERQSLKEESYRTLRSTSNASNTFRRVRFLPRPNKIRGIIPNRG